MLQQLIDSGNEVGLVGSAVDLPLGRVDVWWCGEVPPALRQAGANADVAVSFHPAVYPSEVLNRALDMVRSGRVGSAPLDRPLRELGVTVNVGTVACDGSGLSLTVSVNPDRPIRTALDRAEQVIADATKVEVVLVLGDAPQ